jgi:cytochrome P450
MNGRIRTGIDAPMNDEDPFSDSTLADPGPLHARLRAAGPVVYLTRYGVFGIASYAAVREVLRNWQTFRSGAGVGLETIVDDSSAPPASLLLEADPPLHDAPRQVLSSLLRPRAVHRLRESWMKVAVDCS